MQQETKELERRWEICMEVVGGKCMDNATSSKIRLMNKVTDKCAKEMERNEEHERMLDQADCWMERRNKTFRLMMDWCMTEDGHGETQMKKKCWKHLTVHEEDDEYKDDWGEEPVSNEVSFLLKDPVAFECVTRCSMTGEERMDTTLTHEMAVAMKVR